MKRFLSFILLVSLLVGCISLAEAENATTIDVKTMNDDALSVLAAEIKSEMISRGLLKENTIYSGLYLAGRDIDVGSFVYTNQELGEGITQFLIWIFPDMAAWDRMNADGRSKSSAEKNAINYYTIHSPGEKIIINLEKGNVLYIPYGVGVLEVNQQAWLP